MLSLRSITSRAISTGGLMLTVSFSAHAHHSAAPHFDLDRSISVLGTVTKFEFVNPHAYVYFVTENASGQVEDWRCELAAKAFLSRMGWTADTFAVGQKYQFKGSPARREEHVCTLNSFVRSDGTEFDVHRSVLGAVRNTPAATDTTAVVKSPTDTHEKFAGNWVSKDQGGPGRPPEGRAPGFLPPPGEMARQRPEMPQPSAAGLAAAKNYDQRFDDPAIKCSPGNIIFGWTHDQNVNRLEFGDHIILLKYGYMDFVRTIHMDGAQHPKTVTPSLGGHSIGSWDGDTLVVDTIGFTPGVLNPLGGILHSDRLHIVERFSLSEDGGQLIRTYQVEDPLYLKSSYSGRDVMYRTNEAFVKYHCVELSGKNNQR